MLAAMQDVQACFGNDHTRVFNQNREFVAGSSLTDAGIVAPDLSGHQLLLARRVSFQLTPS